MNKGINSIAAGAAVALAAGTAVYLFSGKKSRTMKKFKRTAGKAMKVMEDLAGNVSYMMKQDGKEPAGLRVLFLQEERGAKEGIWL